MYFMISMYYLNYYVVIVSFDCNCDWDFNFVIYFFVLFIISKKYKNY